MKNKLLSGLLVFSFLLLLTVLVSSCSIGGSQKGDTQNVYSGEQNEDADSNGTAEASGSENEIPKPMDIDPEGGFINQASGAWQSPWKQYLLGTTVYMLMENAKNTIALKCMKQNGFPDFVSNIHDLEDDPAYSDEDVDLLDLELAKKWGYDGGSAYGISNGSLEYIKQPNGSYQLEYSKKYEENRVKNRHKDDPNAVKKFTEKGGCQDQSQDIFYRDIPANFEKPVEDRQISALMVTSRKNAAVNPEIQNTLKAYSQCMRKAGFDFDVPPRTEIFSDGQFIDYSKYKDKNDLGQKHIAVPDVTCKLQVNLGNIWHKVFAEEANKDIQKNLPVVNRQKEYLDFMTKHSNDIISTNAAGYFD
jgi:hypothetical protein